MKLNSFLFGLLLVSIGALLLLDNLNVVAVHWENIWRLWPLTLVFAGLSFVAHNDAMRIIVAVIFVALIGFVFYALVSGQSFFADYLTGTEANYDKNLSSNYTSDITRAELAVDTKAGSVYLIGVSTKLADVDVLSSVGPYDLTEFKKDDLVKLTLKNSSNFKWWSGGKHRNTANIKLNPNPTWDLGFDIGAAKAVLDLTGYNVDRLSIDAGAADINIRLNNLKSLTGTINTGASSVKITSPQDAGVEIKGTFGASGVNCAGLDKIGDNTYRSPNFETATIKHVVNVSAGASSINFNYE